MTTVRQAAREARRQARTAEKVLRSRGLPDDASVAFDEARKLIAGDPNPERQANRWKRLVVLLTEFAEEIRTSDRR